MNSRERVLAAFDHQEPDRAPCWCGASPEFLAKARRELSLPDDENFFMRKWGQVSHFNKMLIVSIDG